MSWIVGIIGPGGPHGAEPFGVQEMPVIFQTAMTLIGFKGGLERLAPLVCQLLHDAQIKQTTDGR